MLSGLDMSIHARALVQLLNTFLPEWCQNDCEYEQIDRSGLSALQYMPPVGNVASRIASCTRCNIVSNAELQDSKRTPAGNLVSETPVIQQKLVGRHELVGPSIRLPEKFFKELNDKTGGQPAYVWNVDDITALRKAVAVGAKGVISNQPLAMQAELNKLKARCSRQASVT